MPDPNPTAATGLPPELQSELDDFVQAAQLAAQMDQTAAASNATAIAANAQADADKAAADAQHRTANQKGLQFINDLRTFYGLPAAQTLSLPSGVVPPGALSLAAASASRRPVPKL